MADNNRIREREPDSNESLPDTKREKVFQNRIEYEVSQVEKPNTSNNTLLFRRVNEAAMKEAVFTSSEESMKNITLEEIETYQLAGGTQGETWREKTIKEVLESDVVAKKFTDNLDKHLGSWMKKLNDNIDRIEKKTDEMAARIEEVAGMTEQSCEAAEAKINKLESEIDNKIEAKLDEKLTLIEPTVQVDGLSEKIEDIDLKLDELDQASRANNIILMGLKNHDNTVPDILRLFNVKLGVNVKQRDLDFVVPLRRMKEEKIIYGAKIVFIEKRLRMKIFKARTRLKGLEIWITDDLTPYRNTLLFMGRECIRAETAEGAWSFDGKVFIKLPKEDSPMKVQRLSDLPAPVSENN